MTAEIRDLYGQLIDGMQGTRGQLKTGGDAARRRAAGQPADAKAAGAVFRHRHGRRRRHRRDQFRHSGVRRHRARDGGGLDRHQARPRHDRCHGARSRGADRDIAALPAQWRSRHHEFRSRQRRRCAGRLHHQRQDLGAGEGDRQSRHHRKTRRQAAQLDVAGARCRRRRHRELRRRYQGPERADAGAALCARRQAGDADPGAPLDPDAGQGREPDPDLRHVLGSGAGHRRRLAVGQPVDGARCRDHPEGAGPLSLWLFGADHQPRHAAALRQRSGGRRASGDGYRGRSAHQGCDRPAAGAARLERIVRAVVGRRRRRLARRLCDGLPDPRPRKGVCGAGCAVQERARSHPQLGGERQRAGKGRRPRSRLRPLCARPQWRRPDRRSALSRRHQAEQSGDADRKVAAGGRAGAGRRQDRGRSGSMPPRSKASRRSRCWSSAASITAAPCAMPRRWSRWPAKATRRRRR